MAFDPAYTAAGLVLSNNNLTVTAQTIEAGGYYSNALSTDSPGGKIYAEIKLTSTDLTSCAFGIGIHGMDIGPSDSASLGGPGTLGIWSNGYTYNGAWRSGAVVSYTSNDVLALALDTAGATIQIRNVTQNSAWSSAISISALTGPFFFAYCTSTANDVATANFSGPFAGALPPGYTGWSPAGPPSSGGWGQKAYYETHNVFGAPGDPAPGAWAIQIFHDTHSPTTLT